MVCGLRREGGSPIFFITNANQGLKSDFQSPVGAKYR